MTEAFIVAASRTATGKRGGGLAEVHPADLAAAVIRDVLDRSGLDPSVVDDVVLGCTDQFGAQGNDVARTAWLAAGLPLHVPGTTIDRQCGSSQQAVHFAAQAIMSGTMDAVVAGGVQLMSQIPIGSSAVVGQQFGHPDPFSGSEGWRKRFGDAEFSQFTGAEEMARRWGLTRDAMEEFSADSHRKARRAQAEGRFDGQILPYAGVAADEGVRDPDLDAMRALPALVEGGRITAATASQISDSAAALLVVSERVLESHGLTPLARVHWMTVLADDPLVMLTAPIPATKRALERSGMSIDQIDLYEVNEAFASVPMAWLAELDADPARLNVNGGAIALGHPVGASGARLMTTLLAELERTGGRYGLQTMCEGGGQANVTIIERLSS